MAKSKQLPCTKAQIEKHLEESMGSITQAAKNMGVPYSTLYSWIERLKIRAYPDKIKRKVATLAFERAKYLALSTQNKLSGTGDKADVSLLKEILRKWGKYIEFGEADDTVASENGDYEGKRPYKAPRDLMEKRDESLGQNKRR